MPIAECRLKSQIGNRQLEIGNNITNLT